MADKPNDEHDQVFDIMAESDWATPETASEPLAEPAVEASDAVEPPTDQVMPPPLAPPLRTDNPPDAQASVETEVTTHEDPPPINLTLGYGAHAPGDSMRYRSLVDVSTQVASSPVHDTALDALELPAISMRAVSVRGRDHRLEGSVRQDNYSFHVGESTLTCAVADGVGSASHSQIGSRIAAHWAVTAPELVVHHKQQRDDLEHPWQTDHVSTCDLTFVASQILAETATLDEVAPHDVSTTLVSATVELAPVATPPAEGQDGSGTCWLVTLTSIGDSGFALIRDGSWEPIGVDAVGDTSESSLSSGDEPDHQLAKQGGVEALPTVTLARSRTLALLPRDVLILATDGILDIAEGVAEFREELAALWRHGDPTMSQLLRLADALVKSYSDDRTLVAIHVGAGTDV